MSTLTATPETPESAQAAPARPVYRVTGRRVLSSEWAKLWSLRSTWITLGLGLLFLVAFGVIAASHYKSSLDSGRHMDRDFATATAVSLSLFGTNFAQLALGVLGVLVTAGEYSTGMIRSTLAAVPTRVPVLVAKAIVLAVLTVVVATVSIALSYVVTMPLLTDLDLVPALDQARTWQVFGGTVYFLVAAGLFALGVGTLLRSSAAAITVALTVLLLLPGVLSFIRLNWLQTVVDYLPLPASGAFLGGSEDSLSSAGEELSPVTGLLVIAAYAVVPLIAGAVVLRRRDA